MSLFVALGISDKATKKKFFFSCRRRQKIRYKAVWHGGVRKTKNVRLPKPPFSVRCAVRHGAGTEKTKHGAKGGVCVLWDRNDVQTGAQEWTGGLEWFFLQWIGHIWISMWRKLQLHILKKHYEIVMELPSKTALTFLFSHKASDFATISNIVMLLILYIILSQTFSNSHQFLNSTIHLDPRIIQMIPVVFILAECNLKFLSFI
jgi:hypothetical protein